jgi:hypothetical protein
LLAVCESAGGRIFTSDDPKNAVAAFWCKAADAPRVAEMAWRVGDIMTAGQRCGVALTAHAVVRTLSALSALIEARAAHQNRLETASEMDN